MDPERVGEDLVPCLSRAEHRLRAADLDPVVRLLLLRDVLALPEASPELKDARASASTSVHVRRLQAAQLPDGSWGPFHSMRSAQRARVPTTEAGVTRALALGLEDTHPVLRRAGDYIERILANAEPFPDRAEVNARWPIGTTLFAAGTLARFRPASALLAEPRSYWTEVATATFASGRHDPEAELACHRSLSGLNIRELRYLELGNAYALALLGSCPGLMAENVERAYCRWLWTRCVPHPGPGYLQVDLDHLPPPHKPGLWDRWLAAQQLMASLPTWARLADSVLGELVAVVRSDGLWDFGPRPPGSPRLPLSESWRTKGVRAHDWTVRVLGLAARLIRSVASDALGP